MHPRNLHKDRYPIQQLCTANPGLAQFVHTNKGELETIDFHNPVAVKALNLAILKHYYKIQYWDVPEGYLIPGVPGRADYIHHAADLLTLNGNLKKQNIAKGAKIKCLDIGVGANCIYPIIGIHEYGWKFIGSEVDQEALASAHDIIKKNKHLTSLIELRKQSNKTSILKEVITSEEYIDLVICNPPFHHSAKAAKEANKKKNKNLKEGSKKSNLNFGGSASELWCVDGEEGFLQKMITESQQFKSSVHWFTILLSKEKSVLLAQSLLQKIEGQLHQVIPINRGNKKTRILAWSFLNKKQKEAWINARWK